MFDVAMLMIATCMLIHTIAYIVRLYMKERKVYKITLSHVKLNSEYSFVTYVYATNVARAAREIQDKAYVIRSIEEVKDV